MPIADAIAVLAVFGGFGFLIWSRLVQRNHPIVGKIKDWMGSKKENSDEKELSPQEKVYQAHIERKIM